MQSLTLAIKNNCIKVRKLGQKIANSLPGHKTMVLGGWRGPGRPKCNCFYKGVYIRAIHNLRRHDFNDFYPPSLL